MAVNIQKIKDGKWKVTVSYNNKIKRITVGSKRQAISLKDEIELNIARRKLGFMDNNCSGKPVLVSFKTVAEEWQLDHFDNVKPATQERYETILRLYVIPQYGRVKDVQTISRADVLKYLKAFYKGSGSVAGKSVSVTERVCSILSLIFQYAQDMEYVVNNPAINIKKSLKLKRVKKVEIPFSIAELGLLLNVVPDMRNSGGDCNLRLFFLFAFRTGCRLGECLGLHWDDIDFDSGVVTIKRTCRNRKTGTPKNGKERTIDLSPQLVQELRAYKKVEAERLLRADGAGSREMVIVFHRDGDYIANQRIARTWAQMFKDVNINVRGDVVPVRTFHNIRHSVATLLIAGGLSPKAVQHQLGHHSARFTMDVYTKYMKTKDVSITAVLDKQVCQ